MGDTYVPCLQMSAVQMSAPMVALWITYLPIMHTSRECLAYRNIYRRPVIRTLPLPLHWLWRGLKQPAKCRCLHCCWVRWILPVGSISIARGALRSSMVAAWLLPTLAAGYGHTAVSTVCVGRAELQTAVGSLGWAGQTGQRRAWVHTTCWTCMWSLPWGVLELRQSRDSVLCLAGGPDCPQWTWLRLWPVGLGQILLQLGKQENLAWFKWNYDFFLLEVSENLI